MAPTSPLEMAQWDFMLTGMEKDYCLVAGAPKTHCHVKPMVSTLSNLLIIILLMIDRAMTRGIYLLTVKLLKLMTPVAAFFRTVRELRTIKVWWYGFKRLTVILILFLMSNISQSTIFKVGKVCADVCWRYFFFQIKILFAVMPSYPVCKFECSNVGCGWIFGSKLGLKIHRG